MMDNVNVDMEYLRQCRLLIEEKLNWRPATEWRNYEFVQLSEKIFDDTGVALSTTTLKRLFGKVRYDSLPSTATLNALAKFIGFSSWMEYKSQPQEEKIQPAPQPSQTRIHKKTWLAGTAAVVVCALVALLFSSGKAFNPRVDDTDAMFTSRPVAAGLPNSVVFNLDLKGAKPRNVVIQQSWDTSRTVKLQPGQREATGIYYFPGYFRAKLILDGRIVKEHDLFIKSEKWMATIDHKPIPSYVSQTDLVLDGKMDISDELIEEIKKIQAPTFLTYHLVKPFDKLSSDNFLLEASVKNRYSEGPAVCRTVKVFVLCTTGVFIVPFTIPGCISDVNLKASDHYVDGKSNDLSSFGVDLSDWSDVKIETRDRSLRIYFRDKLIREARYTEDAGEIVGIRFSFLGAGAVKYVRLSDGGGNMVYDEDFNGVGKSE